VKRAALSSCALLALVPVLFIAAAVGVLGGGAGVSLGQGSSALEVAGIPAEYLGLFQAAGARYGVPWAVLAGIGKLECDDGQDPDPSCTHEGSVNYAGAGGPMQFLAATWAAYAVDGDGDGRTDRWDAADAIFTAAHYLRASGAPGEMERAIFAYNHSSAYVAEVLRWAARYESEAQTLPAPASGAAGGALSFALAQIGVPYVWGGESPSGYDCSGLVQAAYRSAGIGLPRTSEEQFGVEPHLPPGATLAPGDLVFFGPSPGDATHVGIVVRPGEMVDAPKPGTHVRTEPFPTTVGAAWGDERYLGAARPSAR
jgi:cell wall-associated NlpC family hydrolase